MLGMLTQRYDFTLDFVLKSLVFLKCDFLLFVFLYKNISSIYHYFGFIITLLFGSDFHCLISLYLCDLLNFLILKLKFQGDCSRVSCIIVFMH